MTKQTRYTIQGFIMLIAPLFIALAFDWYLLVTAYYLVLFGIFVHGELGWKGVAVHMVFIILLLLLANQSGNNGGTQQYHDSYNSQVDR